MLERIFTMLYEAMLGTAWVALLASFIWGILSILLSPCHLSSIPLVVGYISSQGKISAKKNILHITDFFGWNFNNYYSDWNYNGITGEIDGGCR